MYIGSLYDITKKNDCAKKRLILYNAQIGVVQFPI